MSGRFQKLGVLILLAVLTVGALWLWSGRQQPAKHLVLVVLDTLRADRMSIYGHSVPTTPALESRAGELLRFADVKAPAPWTVPTHASIFTGLRPAEHGARWGAMRLGDEHETLAEILGPAGFCSTGLSSNLLVAKSTGLTQGFDSFDLIRGPWPDKTPEILSRLPAVLDDARDRECRLFLFLNLMDAHIPYNTSRYGGELGVDDAGPIHNARLKWEVNGGVRELDGDERRRHRAAYDAAVRYLDDVLAELFELLAAGGVLEETLVVVTSDHGDGLGYHPEIGHSISIWEEQLAVPLLVRLPAGRRGGEVVTRRTGLGGLLPSMLDWLGVARPPPLADRPGLEAGDEPVTADYRSYFAEGNRGVNQRTAERYPQLAAAVGHSHAYYCDRFKLIVRQRGEPGFYDLAADPDEQQDLVPVAPRQLRDCLRAYREAVADGLLTPLDLDGPGDDGEPAVDLETLRSLGYVN